MLPPISPLGAMRQALVSGTTTPLEIAVDCAAHANANASHNTYLHFDREALLAEAKALEVRFPDPASRPPLYGIPITLKDLFDLAGTVTTCASRFYAERTPPATEDSAMAKLIKASGGLIPGKTHLHQLAYGITGENPDYGDCVQPRDAALLCGGSSSGAVASVQEGSALAAIGTDTGGSIRVPAALGGLTGYRASHGLAYAPGPWPDTPEGLWQGGAHLAASFDTAGFLLRDPRDAAPIANALFGVPLAAAPEAPRIGFVDDAFLFDADPDALAAFATWREQLASADASIGSFDTSWWSDSREICAGIQASEAAAIHRGHFQHFEAAIAQRLQWGADITPDELAHLRERHAEFRARIAELFAEFDFLVVPCAPVGRLFAGADQSQTRPAILRYTTPFSLAGTPVITLPGEIVGAPLGTGIQLAAPAGEDASLLAFAAALGQSIAMK
jgi:aspartyl-tRNA(Asn)/glutamyl-tRNA(Gln) amidotransferase subunit A